MLFFIITTPGDFGAWCERAAAELAAKRLGATTVLRADSLDLISSGLLRETAARTLVLSSTPASGLRSALLESRRPFLIALDDPMVGVAQLVESGAAGVIEATRMVANSCASIMPMRSVPSATILRADQCHGENSVFAAVISGLFGLSADNPETASVLANRPTYEGDQERQRARDWWQALGSREAAVAAGAIAAYGDLAGTAGTAPIEWAADLFFDSGNTDRPVAGPLDITGLPRCLFRGPHIVVESGPWSLSLALSFSPETAEHDFLIEVSGCQPSVHRAFKPGRGGLLEGTIEIMIPEAMDPVDICMSSQRAAFEGNVTLIGARLTRVTDGADRVIRRENLGVPVE